MTDLNAQSHPDPVESARDLAAAPKSRRGRLTIFFGYAAGVGKTYEMLESAQTLAIKGANVLIGYVEPHGWPETEALLLGLDILPGPNHRVSRDQAARIRSGYCARSPSDADRCG